MDRESVLKAIVGCAGFNDVEQFRCFCQKTNDIDDYFLGGLLKAVEAVEKLYAVEEITMQTVEPYTKDGDYRTWYCLCGNKVTYKRGTCTHCNRQLNWEGK